MAALCFHSKWLARCSCTQTQFTHSFELYLFYFFFILELYTYPLTGFMHSYYFRYFIGKWTKDRHACNVIYQFIAFCTSSNYSEFVRSKVVQERALQTPVNVCHPVCVFGPWNFEKCTTNCEMSPKNWGRKLFGSLGGSTKCLKFPLNLRIIQEIQVVSKSA